MKAIWNAKPLVPETNAFGVSYWKVSPTKKKKATCFGLFYHHQATLQKLKMAWCWSKKTEACSQKKQRKLITKITIDIWCDFDRATSLICGNKMPTRSNRGFYCRSYCLLNMFQAPLCPSSGAQEYYTVVAACGISCCGFQVAGLVWSWGHLVGILFPHINDDVWSKSHQKL